MRRAVTGGRAGRKLHIAEKSVCQRLARSPRRCCTPTSRSMIIISGMVISYNRNQGYKQHRTTIWHDQFTIECSITFFWGRFMVTVLCYGSCFMVFAVWFQHRHDLGSQFAAGRRPFVLVFLLCPCLFSFISVCWFSLFSCFP